MILITRAMLVCDNCEANIEIAKCPDCKNPLEYVNQYSALCRVCKQFWNFSDIKVQCCNCGSSLSLFRRKVIKYG